MDLATLAQQLRAGTLTVAGAAAAAAARAQRHALLNCFISLAPDHDPAAIASAQSRLAEPDAEPLAGIPIAHKDIFCTAGLRTTCASQMLADYVPPYESHATAQLALTGAISIGKCNMDEFAMGTTGENSSFGPTLNPWQHSRCAGGSSSGSAAAVAARIVPAATGTDTGGSVRLPAAYCGVCGIKPTYGMISRRGMVAYASSLDQAGAFATCAADLRTVLAAMIGHDRHDSTSLPDAAIDAPAPLKRPLVIGVAEEFFGAGVAAGVAAQVRAAVAQLGDAGFTIAPISFAHLQYAVPAYYIIACAEASSNLARYDGMLYGSRAAGAGLGETIINSRTGGFGKEVQRRIMLGTFVLSHGYVDAYYRQAQKIRHVLIEDFAKAFASCDLIAAPTAPTVAPQLGELGDDPLRMYSQDVCTVPASLAGLPALSLPCGMLDGLPVGLQLIGPARSEHMLLDVAERYQLITEHHLALPPGCGDE